MAKDLTKTEVQKIVRDEIKDFVSKELEGEIEKLIKKSTSKARKEIVEISKDAIEKLAEFLWIRRNIWKKDIR